MNTQQQNLESLQGQVEKIIYSGSENYVIAKVKSKGNRKPITVIGNITAPVPGQVIQMQGKWFKHQKFGFQFRVLSYECKLPATVTGIKKYLGSGLIDGIGGGTAEKIVKAFGNNTMKILDSNPDRLKTIDGIGNKRAEMIKKGWQEHREINNIMVFLITYGVSPNFAVKIFETYGSNSIKKVKENPYRLAIDISGIGFSKADQIAQEMGISEKSIFRIQAGILHILYNKNAIGHAYYPAALLIDEASAFLEVESNLVAQSLGYLKLDEKIVIEEIKNPRTNQNHKAVYLPELYFAETSIARKLKQLLNTPKTLSVNDADNAVAWVQHEYAMSLADQQKEAVRKALLEKILVITGGPGTGKSFLLDALIKIESQLNTKLLLAAPTGRAAKRMQEATGQDAKTIHRLLNLRTNTSENDRYIEPLLNCGVIIIDEMSMVDTFLMNKLLNVLKPETTLIMIGDVNQLPSIGAGNILKDIISSGVVPVVELNEVYRQAKDSAIISNAYLINQGEMPEINSSGEKNDFLFIEQEEPEKVLETIKHYTATKIPSEYNLNSIDDIQILSPMRNSDVGVENLNIELQAYLNPNGKELKIGNRIFRVGDKVMQIRNNYGKEVFNGDIGKISGIIDDKKEIFVTFNDRVVMYQSFELNQIELAYAISIHKSQGSDYPAVIIPVSTQHRIMLQRNLIYTGVTRGRQLVVLVGTQEALEISVRETKRGLRYTYLAERLR